MHQACANQENSLRGSWQLFLFHNSQFIIHRGYYRHLSSSNWTPPRRNGYCLRNVLATCDFPRGGIRTPCPPPPSLWICPWSRRVPVLRVFLRWVKYWQTVHHCVQTPHNSYDEHWFCLARSVQLKKIYRGSYMSARGDLTWVLMFYWIY